MQTIIKNWMVWNSEEDFEAEDLNEPHRLNRAELSDFIRNLDLLKTDSKASGIQTVAMKLIPTRRQGYREQDL
ncbi:hypothetical protein TNCV_1663811 [Trichonephila clavipes]|nr:hypothetical protein TNCV_1663811 [Trichonephila clavipes]